jgi:mitochondrial fission protein ELM1
VARLSIARRRIVPVVVLTRLLKGVSGHPALALRLGYGINSSQLPAADVVISAGGDTIIANAAAARLTGAANIFCGTLRKLAPDHFSLIVSSYARHAGLPRHIVTLKPNKLDPDALGRPRPAGAFGRAHPPAMAGLLIGGDSGLFRYRDDEWDRLFAFAREVHRHWGTRWIVSTSRRTGAYAEAAAAAFARDNTAVDALIDYRTAGPGTLTGVFNRADVIICTEDSSTMISEAVSVRLPVVGVSPAHHGFKPEEAEYRQLMFERGWCRVVPIAELSLDRLDAALASITPLSENHLDILAAMLEERLASITARGADTAP